MSISEADIKLYRNKLATARTKKAEVTARVGVLSQRRDELKARLTALGFDKLSDAEAFLASREESMRAHSAALDVAIAELERSEISTNKPHSTLSL